MAAPYVGEIRLFGFNFSPPNWALCNGATIPIRQNTTLYSVISNYFGGDGTTTFNLPDFRGRAALCVGPAPGQTLGEQTGQAAVTLTIDQIPSHNHVLNAATLTPPNPAQNVAAPSPQALLGLSGPNNTYIDPVAPDAAFSPSAISPTGNSVPHDNMMPYVAVNYCIAVSGTHPARN